MFYFVTFTVSLSYLWWHIIKEALCYWIIVNIVRYWAERCTGSFLVSIYWTVRPVSSPCSKERMPLWLPRRRCGRLFLAISSISFVFVTIINYNVLKELPTDPNYWSRTNIRGLWRVNSFYTLWLIITTIVVCIIFIQLHVNFNISVYKNPS